MIKLEKNDFWRKLKAGDESTKRKVEMYILMRDYICGVRFNRRMKAKGEPVRKNLLGIQHKLTDMLGERNELKVLHFVNAVLDIYHNIQPWFTEKTMFLRENHNFTTVCLWYTYEQTTGEEPRMYGINELTYNYITSGEHCSTRAGEQFFKSTKELFEQIK